MLEGLRIEVEIHRTRMVPQEAIDKGVPPTHC